ncbi:hypothetical protein GCM10009096_00660 [Parasphingorhabdus litoris]|uniref:Rap1a immunity protein domain-containing protein n=1 Tax=Parasphingorhabdus litoris TaxID=394733 RepID=A0ABN0ZZQ6_9SPHN
MVSSAVQAASQWTGNRKITEIYPHASGFIYQLDGAQINDPSCNENRLYIPITAANYDAIVSSLITAFTSKYSVNSNYDDSTASSCQAVVNRVRVTP